MVSDLSLTVSARAVRRASWSAERSSTPCPAVAPQLLLTSSLSSAWIPAVRHPPDAPSRARRPVGRRRRTRPRPRPACHTAPTRPAAPAPPGRPARRWPRPCVPPAACPAAPACTRRTRASVQARPSRPGLRMWAMLTPASPLLARPTYSSISFGLLPAAVTRVGFSIRVGIVLLHSLCFPREPGGSPASVSSADNFVTSRSSSPRVDGRRANEEVLEQEGQLQVGKLPMILSGGGRIANRWPSERLSEKPKFHNLFSGEQIRRLLYGRPGAACAKLIEPISPTNNGARSSS